ncbi:hypothetical protein [Secundilactobacillus kimchicus]|uniref:hypothetical protein n=1 Tax=Secundilactobacillus kimchicus TaxID=528209 RepID=UPI000AF07079
MQEANTIIKAAHDRDVNLAVGQSRTEKKWHNETMRWSEFVDRLSRPTVTQETYDRFMKLGKAKRDEVKDVGGYVGGFLKEGRRKADKVQSRSLITLDADFATSDMWDEIQLLFDNAIAVYSTHSHGPGHTRLRLIIPMSRIVTAEEYQPVARKVAQIFGMDLFDDTTYQAERLMYWPSHSIDGEYFFEYMDGDWLDPDEILAKYDDWHDATFWPESSRQKDVHVSAAKRQSDPLEKKGVIGAFNRTYSIVDAIEKFLPDVYAPTSHPDRYTYINGSTEGGLVLYEDKFAYSHHGTDPVGDTLNSAFDLVRKQKFGDLDDEAKPGTPVTRLPSYKAMGDFARADDEVRQALAEAQISDAHADFDIVEDDNSWMRELDMTDAGVIDSTATNLKLILDHDPNLKDAFALDSFSQRLEIKRDMPWRELRDERGGKIAILRV